MTIKIIFIILGLLIIGTFVYLYMTSLRYDKTIEFNKKELAASLRINILLQSIKDSNEYTPDQLAACLTVMQSGLNEVIKEQHIKKILNMQTAWYHYNNTIRCMLSYSDFFITT